jgi:uncharacterized protein
MSAGACARSRFAALALAAALVGWSATAGLRVSARWWHPLLQAVLGAGLVALTRARLGVRPPALWSGVAAGTALPRVRSAMAGRDVPAPAAAWLALRIPLGTVWFEEAAYRAALATVAASAFGTPAGRLLQAAAFGLSHIRDARVAGEPVLPTVLATGVAGWLFGWLAERSGSLAAPALTHLAINEAGAVAVLATRRG